MTTDSTAGAAAAQAPAPVAPPEFQADPRRWKALGVLALIQFMLVLDITVVNVALPQHPGRPGLLPVRAGLGGRTATC